MFSLQSDFVFFSVVYIFSSILIVAGTFTTDPSEQNIKEGGRAYIFCFYETYYELESQEIAWLRSGARISRNNEIISEAVDDPSRYIIELNEDTRRYGLTIQSIKRSDATQYACAVYNGETRTLAKEAVLTVKEIPKKPICVSVDDTYLEGSSATIRCGVEVTEPSATVTWKKGNIILETFSESTDENGWMYYSHTFTPSYEDNRSTFTCQVTTDVDPDFVENCTTGAINVLYKPRVTIPESTDINEGQEAILFCESDANPDALAYDWAFEPDLPDHQTKLEKNNKILRILNPTKELNQSKVTCISSNTVGSGSAYVYLLISSPRLKTYTTGSVYDPNEPYSDDGGVAFTVPLILALAGGCSVLFLFLLLIPICYIHMFGRKRVMTPDGRIIAQPDIYFEPRDRIMPPLPGLPEGMTWVRSVGVQVPGEAESESSFYAEISGSRKSACSAYGSYTGYGTYGRRSTYI